LVVRQKAGFNVVCKACGCLGVVAKESANEQRGGVVDRDDAEWVAVKVATINEIHCAWMIL
jgi:hypothetical protein